MKNFVAATTALLIALAPPAFADRGSKLPNSDPKPVASKEAPETQAEPITIPEQLIANLQRDFGLTRSQAAGITGNLAHESGNFRMLAEIDGGCYGYSQWCGPRKSRFRSYAARVGGQESFQANYGYLHYELKTEYGEMMSRIRATDDVSQVARIFMKTFLRPRASTANLQRRVRFSKMYLADRFDGAGCYSHFQLEARNRPAACPEST
ncbi:hypothetical protein SAMN05421666_0479 [Roseovarius nanhaiticus]|uniref:Phage tail lysozyme domain-containing protein n=1 Tax=Roseovarius nanhaiticus TaxID=573024 RepID=A0A1N7ERN0_9RHOB|nr:phage tail tip lysozyme [Roseovarius nanhaiticus]SEK67971.1 hypothetical protein SAMN05216208_1656 [Roseovarius nanhaiticus]SIR90763.1 hypothetical protein SAMN05421666_0479 [Roseovarius nanhaiticus]